MNFIFHHVWLAGIGFAIAGVILIFLGGRWIALFASWLQVRMMVRSGRTITWENAIGRCKAEAAAIVVESKQRPKRVWFITGDDESAFFSRKGRPRSKGLLVIDPPDASRISEEAEKVGVGLVEIDMNATFW